jgi:hypothetical protein
VARVGVDYLVSDAIRSIALLSTESELLPIASLCYVSGSVVSPDTKLALGWQIGL